ncbi:MAG TPA: 3-hydroxyacyl-CoA dehydrogenase family protein [Longimicrobiales bacterium]|nr:3-hydroxyacyl-CoA dehydrogenase family protein [Longimicrobiales bacterium]
MIRRVVVVGGGTMGHGIAQVSAMAGHDTTLVDTDDALVEAALARVAANLDEGVKRGKVDEATRSGTLARLTGATDAAAAAADADLLVEAVPERFDLKAGLLARLAEAAPGRAVLGTNTSSLSITDLQDATPAPERVVGLHFFNPVHIMALVEVVRGARTAETTVEAGVAWARALGKDPIVVNDAPGFASSRLGVALGLEAMRMLEQGVADAADIDKAMELGYRHPMGPLRLTDLVGLDVRLDIARYLHEKLGTDVFRPPEILERLVARGHLGRKTGRGFYDWSEG